MQTKGRILVADDEELFLRSTADLLGREGYQVDVAPDGASAIDKVRAHDYDLLVSDLQMPGNEDLALIREIDRIAGGLPVIVVTGYPTMSSAIASIELPVTAYLLKPVSFPEIRDRIDGSIARFRSYRAMQRAEQRLGKWREEVQGIMDAPAAEAPTGVDAFLSLTLRNVMGSLSDLEQLSRALSGRSATAEPCQLVNCPRGSQLRAAVKETIDTLEETKSAFKSKTLAALRKKLELLLQFG